MKLRHIISLTTLGTLAYVAYQNRKELEKEGKEFLAELKRFHAASQKAQREVSRILHLQGPLKQVTADLNYSFRVFQNQAQAHLKEIERIQKK